MFHFFPIFIFYPIFALEKVQFKFKSFMIKKRSSMQQYFRCVILYHEFGHVRSLHYAVRADYVDNFTNMINDTFVHPDISYTYIIYTYDNLEFFNLI